MRSYFKAFLSPDGRTCASTDLWGNYHVIAVMRQPVTNIFDAINTLNNGVTGNVYTWRGLDRDMNIVEEHPGQTFGFQFAYFGYRNYADHPLN